MSEYLGFDAEMWVPADRNSFPLYEIAERLQCSTKHIWNLVQEKEIDVPQEHVDRAKSKTAVQVPRESFVEFLKRRSGPEFLARREKSRKKRPI